MSMERRLIQLAVLISSIAASYLGFVSARFVVGDTADLAVAETQACSTETFDESPSNSRPNIVLIVLDDADAEMFSDPLLQAHFPNIRRIAAEGIRFENCHVTTPICAPSRASFLRGQYAHNTGVCVNDPATPMSNGFSGSYSEYKSRGLEKNDLSVWLQKLGYRTMLVGKYLHNNFDFKVPPGWDDFCCSLGNKYFQTTRYTKIENQAARFASLGAEEYRTQAEAAAAERLIQVGSSDSRPFFLYLTPMAPHEAENPSRRVEPTYRNLWPNLRPNAGPDFNEADLSDKLNLADAPPLTAAQIAKAEKLFRDRMLATKSVDDMVGRVYQALESAGVLDQTYIVFTSDHGFLIGQHRLFGKCLPYSAATHVPLFIRGPGIYPGQSAAHLIAHIDVAPTLVELAGGTPPKFVDGKSFAPLVNSPASHPARTWREPILIESWESAKCAGSPLVRPFYGLRTFDELYVEWANGISEYYSLATDPLELENQISDLSEPDRLRLAEAMYKTTHAQSEPIATVIPPEYKTAPLIGADAEISGYACDDRAVDRVDVTIQSTEGLRYWNGSTWQTERVSVPVELQRPAGMLTAWRYPLRLRRDAEHPVERILISAIATDDRGNESAESAPQSIQIDWLAPQTKVSVPLNHSSYPGEARINGHAWDNIHAVSVRMTLRDLCNRQYWDGRRWTASPSSVSLKINSKGKWHCILPTHPSRYGVWITAIDSVGNVDPTPATAVFEVK